LREKISYLDEGAKLTKYRYYIYKDLMTGIYGFINININHGDQYEYILFKGNGALKFLTLF
jgi:hypothetical protein